MMNQVIKQHKQHIENHFKFSTPLWKMLLRNFAVHHLYILQYKIIDNINLSKLCNATIPPLEPPPSSDP